MFCAWSLTVLCVSVLSAINLRVQTNNLNKLIVTNHRLVCGLQWHLISLLLFSGRLEVCSVSFFIPHQSEPQQTTTTQRTNHKSNAGWFWYSSTLYSFEFRLSFACNMPLASTHQGNCAALRSCEGRQPQNRRGAADTTTATPISDWVKTATLTSSNNKPCSFEANARPTKQTLGGC